MVLFTESRWCSDIHGDSRQNTGCLGWGRAGERTSSYGGCTHSLGVLLASIDVCILQQFSILYFNHVSFMPATVQLSYVRVLLLPEDGPVIRVLGGS